jgi:ribosomal protein S13
LGDDINIFDEDIALEYLSIMKKLGVGINLSKSVVSSTECFEFAKVTGLNGHNVSAISWKM